MSRVTDEQLARLGEYYRGNHDRLRESLMASLPASEHDAGAPGDSASAPILSLRRPWLKIGLGLAAAILLAVAGAWYFGNGHTVPVVRSAYAELAEAYENIKSAEWIHITRTMGGQSSESWMSFEPYKCFTKLPDGTITAADIATSRIFTYDPKSRTLTVQREDAVALKRLKAQGSILDTLMSQLREEEANGNATITREQQAIEGKNYSVVSADLNRDKIRIRLLIDPDSKRLTQAAVFPLNSADAQLIRKIDVDYPETGPADIYELGVPRDAKIGDKTPDSNFVTLRDEALSACDRFIETYTAVRVQMGMDPDGTYRPGNVFLIYKKNGAYRIEQVNLTLQDISPDPRVRRELPDTLEGYLQWAHDLSVQSVKFYSADGAMTETTVEMRAPGKLEKKSTRSSSNPPWISVENETWYDIRHISPNQTAKTEVLPAMTGDFGPLVAIRQTWQGYVDKDGRAWTPSQSDYCLNPERGWTLERKTTVWDKDAPWQQDKDWLTGNDPNEPITEHSRSERLVQEYDQTADGHWYPARILETSEETKTSPTGETSTSDSRHVIFIYLDATREIPDDYMDPENVSPDRFDRKEASWQERFDNAIAEIDRRKDWPETPEAVARAYFDAAAAGNSEEVAVLCPGYNPRKSTIPKDGKPIEFIVGTVERVPGCDQVIVRCARRDLFEKNGKYMNTVSLRNWASKEKRYYVESGPF